MNNTDRRRLSRIMELIRVVPFANVGSGGSTGTVAGLAGFDQDMRAIRPPLIKVIEAMLMERHPDLEEGLDYENPDKLLDDLEAWIEQRKTEGWQDANEYSFIYFRRDKQNA